MGVDVRPLSELLETLSGLDPDDAIFIASAADVRADTPSVLGVATESPPHGYRYLLEVHITQEVLEVWSAWRGGRKPTLDEKLEAVDHYSRTDAYLPVKA